MVLKVYVKRRYYSFIDGSVTFMRSTFTELKGIQPDCKTQQI